MLKAVLHPKTEGARGAVLLGLEAGNIRHLKSGKPIKIDGADIGLHSDIIIMFGKDCDVMIAVLKAQGIVLPPESQWIDER